MSDIVLFDNFKLYKSKDNGVEEGGFYRYKDPESGKVSRCLVKKMLANAIVKEYVSSNIAHLLLNERAPKVDLVFSKQNGTTVIRTASYLLNKFQTLDKFAKKNWVVSPLIDSGYVIDGQNAVLPLQAFSEGYLKENKNLEVFKPLGGAEEFLVVTEFLRHTDLHDQNRGVIEINGNPHNAIVDFSYSLFYNEDFKELFKIEYSHLVSSCVTDKKKMIKAIELLIGKEEEILNLTSKLIYNLNLVGIKASAKIVKSNLKSKITAFKSELQWLKVSLELQGEINETSASQIFSKLENSAILDVSKETVRSVIEYAVKNNVLNDLERQCPEVVYYSNYKELVKLYKMKYDDNVKVTCDENIRPFLMVIDESIEYAVQNNKQNILDVIACNDESGFYFAEVLEAAVKYGNKPIFDMFLSLIQQMRDDNTKDYLNFLDKAMSKSIVYDRPEFAKTIFHEVKEFVSAKSEEKLGTLASFIIERGVEYSILFNQPKFFNGFFSFCEGSCLSTAISSAISLGRDGALNRIISERLDLSERVTSEDGNDYVGRLIAGLVYYKNTNVLDNLLDRGLVLTTEEQDNISKEFPEFFNKMCVDNSGALIVPSNFEFV